MYVHSTPELVLKNVLILLNAARQRLPSASEERAAAYKEDILAMQGQRGAGEERAEPPQQNSEVLHQCATAPCHLPGHHNWASDWAHNLDYHLPYMY